MSELSRAAHAEKQAIIEEIKTKLETAQSAIVIDYAGITVEEANKMRKDLREANVDYKIYKNTLMKRAIEGTAFADLEQILEGPSAFAMSDEDATAPARVLASAMKDLNKMTFKGGVVEGTFYDAEGVEKLSKIPGRETLIAKFMGSIQSPVSKFVRTLAAIAEEKAANGDAPAPAKEEAPAEEAPAEAPAEEAAPAEAPAE
jgi:large subunit ribosomal protein L10